MIDLAEVVAQHARRRGRGKLDHAAGAQEQDRARVLLGGRLEAFQRCP
jgi:hypothetical protein